MVRIGCWAGFWGDTRAAAQQLVRGAELDYLVSDHLAEITMALLARPGAPGYIPDAVDALTPLLGEIRERSIKVVTNAGGLDPAGCAAALRAAGVPLRVACVEASEAHAYLGARPIAAALEMGADVVVTGRCADSAVVLGPLMHELGWSDSDHDLLAAGTLVGHVVECGPQCLGGLFTDWEEVPGWEDMGYPIAECRPDGTATITKSPGTGGLVTPATVAEQVLYEIGDPGAYVVPDVVCDWRGVRVEQEGPDRVRVSGARGGAPTAAYKVTATRLDGHRVVASAAFGGGDAAGRARRMGEALLARAERLAGQRFDDTAVDVVDGGGRAVLRVAARHRDREPLDVLAREVAPFGLVVQGMSALAAGRPRPAPVVSVDSRLVPKGDVTVTVELDGERVEVAVGAGEDRAVGSEPLPEDSPPPVEGGETVPLRRIAHGRSGDKGNDANIGLVARRPELAAVVREQVTAERVAEVFGDWLEGPVRRYELPGLNAINIVLEDVLGGSGGTSSLRLDPQGKSYAAVLLDMPVRVPPGLTPE